MSTSEELTYAGIRFRPDKVSELDGDRTVASVGKADIQAIRLRHGFRARHPLLLAVLGLGLLGIGLYEGAQFVRWLQRGGTLHELQVLLMVMGVVGGWMLWQARSRGYLLMVETKGKQQQLEFGSEATLHELNLFLEEVETTLGYDIEWQTPRPPR